MRDLFPRIASVVVIAGGVVLVLRGMWRMLVSRRLTPSIASEMALGLGFVVVMAPETVYTAMPDNGRNGFFMIAVGLLFVSAFFAVLARSSRNKTFTR
jgi:hypothetical protein